MDVLTLVSLISGIVGIVSFVIQLLIDKEKILLIGKNPNTQKALKLFALLCISFSFYGFVIYPRVKIYNWLPSNTTFNKSNENKLLRLQQKPASLSFRATTYEKSTLLFEDIFPTSLAISLDENKLYLAGTYGAGLFVTSQPPYWEYAGLDNLVITDIVVNPMNPYMIWAGTNLGVAFSNDRGETWNMTGPIQDLVSDLELNPSNPLDLIVGTIGGIYRSSDGGFTWIGPDLDGEVVTSIKMSPLNLDRIYVSCLYGKIYRSDSSGRSWELIREPDGIGSAPLEIDPDNPDVVYIGPSDLGLFRSLDSGETWEYVGLKGISISSILISRFPEKIIAIGTDEDRGFFVSKDNGVTWQNYGVLADPVMIITNEIDTPGQLLVSTKRSGVLKTSDFGNSWSSLGLASFSVITDFSPYVLTIQRNSTNNLVASSFFAKGLYQSSNSGSSWSPLVGNSELLRYSIENILVDPNDINHFFIGTFGGNILESNNGGMSWKNITANLPLGGYPPIGISNDGEIYVGPNDQGIWRKKQSDTLWTPAGLIGYSIESIWLGLNNNIYALDNGQVLHVSHNGGDSWTEPPYLFQAVALSSYDETLIGISDSYEVLKSSDNSRTWRKVKEITPSARALVPSLIIDTETGYIYISYDKILLRSRDFGASWDEFDLPEYGDIEEALGSQVYFLGNQALHVSENYGETFRTVKYSSLIASSTHQIELNPNVFILGTSGNGIFASFDNLESWSQTSLAGKNVLALAKVDKPENRAIALLADFDGVKIAVSTDGKLWSTESTDCNSFGFTTDAYIGYSANYFEEVTNGDEIIWQLECSDPKGILVIKPNQHENSLFFNLSEINLDVSDALLMPDNSIYVLTRDQKEPKVYTIFDLGDKWQLIGQFNNRYTWELVNDTRSDGLLIVKEKDAILGSLYPRQSIPFLVYFAMFATIPLCVVAVFSPGVFREFIIDAKWLAAWLIKDNIKPGVRVSQYFVTLVCPLIILLTILVFQIFPQVNTLSYLISYQSFDNIAYFIANTFLRSGITLLTVDGAVFVGILLTYFIIILITSLILVLAVSSGGYKKTVSTWMDCLGNGFALFTLGIPVLYILSAVLNRFSVVFGQEILGLSFLSIINYWFIYLWFRILGLILFRISDRFALPVSKVTFSVVLWCLLATVGVQILLQYVSELLPIQFQSVVEQTPVFPFGFLTILLILINVLLKRPIISVPLSTQKSSPKQKSGIAPRKKGGG